MAALIRLLAVTNRPISQRQKRKTYGGREEKKTKQRQQTLSEKKEEAGNVSEQCDKGRIHIIRVHDTTHLAVTTTLRGSRRSRDTQ